MIAARAGVILSFRDDDIANPDELDKQIIEVDHLIKEANTQKEVFSVKKQKARSVASQVGNSTENSVEYVDPHTIPLQVMDSSNGPLSPPSVKMLLVENESLKETTAVIEIVKNMDSPTTYNFDSKIILAKYLEFAEWCKFIWQHNYFSTYMFTCIGCAGIVVGLETYPSLATNPILVVMDKVILYSFLSEILLKMIGEGLRPWNYFINAEWKWNWFDFFIVFFSLPILPFGGGGQLKLLRLIRLMRLSKLFKRIPQLNMIMRGLIDSMNFVSYIVLLWFMVIYLYAITGILVFSNNDPWHFQSIEFAFITLFQLTVMDVRIIALIVIVNFIYVCIIIVLGRSNVCEFLWLFSISQYILY